MDAYSKNVKIPLLVVAGPTATGKSALAVSLAEVLGGEVVSADSMQIYKTLDIGTAKPTKEEMRGVPHHLIDFLSPELRYSVADYVADAADAIKSIHERGRLPILCGGTGLYISSLLDGVRFGEEKGKDDVRRAIGEEYDADGGARLFEEIKRSDARFAERLSTNDKKRIVRTVERMRETGKTPGELLDASKPPESPYDFIDIILTDPDRERLYNRIDCRVDRMLELGLLDEARYVYDNRDRFTTAAQAIGYKEFFFHFSGDASAEDCAAALKQASRRYAKRQLTWFRRFSGERVDPEAVFADKIAAMAKKHWKV